jgi:hypothetical protein
MFFRSDEYRCASCGKAGGRAPTKKLRLGPEMNVCKFCGYAHSVAAHEWAHLREAERREFFFSDDLLWVLRIFPWLGLLLATVFDQHEIKWIGLIWGLLATLPWLAITWWWKIREIRKSLERCPPDESSALKRGSLFPWKREFSRKAGSHRK